MVIKRLSGEYAACGFEVLLTRKHEPLVFQVKTNHHHHNNHHHHHDHFEQVYIPCILFVTVSWISFVIDPTVRHHHHHHHNQRDHDDDEGGAGEDVPSRHSLPGHHQRLQQCQVSFHNVNNVKY